MISPIEPTNLSHAVYEQLRHLIIEQVFIAGERLDLNDLEDRFQVSRTPLKTALKRLELEGLVTIQARRGTFIAQTDPNTLEANYKIRSSFELYVALCLFKYLTAADYQHLEMIQNAMNDLVNDCNGEFSTIVEDYLKLDEDLHETLVQIGGPPKMLMLFRQLGVHRDLPPVLEHYSQRDFQTMHFEHEQIFAAIADQSPERLNASLLNHLESARYRVMQYVSPTQK